MSFSQSPQVTCSTVLLHEERMSAESGKSWNTGAGEAGSLAHALAKARPTTPCRTFL